MKVYIVLKHNECTCRLDIQQVFSKSYDAVSYVAIKTGMDPEEDFEYDTMNSYAYAGGYFIKEMHMYDDVEFAIEDEEIDEAKAAYVHSRRNAGTNQQSG